MEPDTHGFIKAFTTYTILLYFSVLLLLSIHLITMYIENYFKLCLCYVLFENAISLSANEYINIQLIVIQKFRIASKVPLSFRQMCDQS